MRKLKRLVLATAATVMLALRAAPASAQGYEGWILHPYPTFG